MALVAFIIYSLSTKVIVEGEEQNLQEYTESVAQGMSQWLESHLNNLQLIAETEDIQSLDAKKQLGLMHFIKDRDPSYETVIFTNAEGVVQAHTTESQIGVLDLTERDYFLNGLKGENSITNVLISGTSGNRIIVVATPVQNKAGEVVGVLSSSVNFEALLEEFLLLDSEAMTNVQAILLDNMNIIQAHPNEKLIGTPLNESDLDSEWKAVLETENMSTGYSRIGKSSEEVLLSAAPIEISGYGLYFTTPMAIVLSVTGTIQLYTFTLIGILALVIIGFAWYFSNQISRPIQLVTNQVKFIADRDLSIEPLTIKSKDEIGYLATNLNVMTQNLRELITQIGDNSSQVSAASEQLMASADQSSEATEHITGTIEEVASGAEEQTETVDKTVENTNTLSTNVSQISSHAKVTSTLSEQALQKAGTGNETIQSTVNQMESIRKTMNLLSGSVQGMGERSQEIDQIVEVISGIAAQTNLLALNAAIEAARAGEHGQGFAVVANEVRNLAEQSSKSAGQITQLITNIQAESKNSIEVMEKGQLEVEQGVEIVHVAGNLFAEIKNDLNEVAGKTREVSASANDMTERMTDVVDSISHIAAISNRTLSGTQTVSAASEEQLASMQEISSSATVLADMAEELQDMILRFRL